MAKINGNQFVKVPHLFVEGLGTFYPTKEAAEAEISGNSASVFGETYDFGGRTYYRCVAQNVWD